MDAGQEQVSHFFMILWGLDLIDIDNDIDDDFSSDSETLRLSENNRIIECNECNGVGFFQLDIFQRIRWYYVMSSYELPTCTNVYDV